MSAKTGVQIHFFLLFLLVGSFLVARPMASIAAQDIPDIRERKPLAWYIERVETVPKDLYRWDFQEGDVPAVFVEGHLVTELPNEAIEVENRLLSGGDPADWLGLPASDILAWAGWPPKVSVVGMFDVAFVRVLVYGEISVILDQQQQVEQVLFNEGLGAEFEYHNIRIGSSLEDVVAAFPETIEVVSGQFRFLGQNNIVFLELPMSSLDAGYVYYEDHDLGIYLTNEIVTGFVFVRE